MSKNETTLMTQEQVFALATILTPGEIAEILENNLLEGDSLTVREIKFPKEGVFWQIANEEGEVVPLKELRAIILDYHALNTYYDSPYDGSKNPPTCSSMDGKTGKGEPGGNCKTCPLGGDDAWGTGKDQKGNATTGKACANKLRIFPLLDGEAMPHQITLPPTNNSKEPGGFRDFINQISNKFKAYQSRVVKLKLEEAETKSHQKFVKLIVSKVEDLSKEEAAKMVAYAKTLRPFLRKTVSEEILHGRTEDEGQEAAYEGGTGVQDNGEGWS